MEKELERDMGSVDCMACLVAMARVSGPSNATYRGPDGITHATFQHDSYGKHQGLTCTYRANGALRLVPR